MQQQNAISKADYNYKIKLVLNNGDKIRKALSEGGEAVN
tara:strand:+ start:105 stop:221 length:117 start_codon:yes stop_codon:yes gene_type:complete